MWLLPEVVDAEKVGWIARVMLVVWLEKEAVVVIVLFLIVDEKVGWMSMVMLGKSKG